MCPRIILLDLASSLLVLFMMIESNVISLELAESSFSLGLDQRMEDKWFGLPNLL